MNEGDFRNYLRKKGKKPEVVARNISNVKAFIIYLEEERTTTLLHVTKDDIETFVEKIELEKKSAKGSLYVLMSYFKFIADNDLLKITTDLRETRTKKSRRIFPLTEFLDIDTNHVAKLAEAGIKNVEQMLVRGRTMKQREQLATQLVIPEEAILELVRLSDITRMGYVRTKLSRLYYNAGLYSPSKVAKFDHEELYEFLKKFVEESGWDGMVPNPKDLINNVQNARQLEQIVEE